MSLINYQVIEEALTRILSRTPIGFARTAYMVFEDDTAIVQFALNSYPDSEQIGLLKELVYEHLDPVIPYLDCLPAWTASVHVGATKCGVLWMNGDQIETWEGGSNRCPVEITS